MELFSDLFYEKIPQHNIVHIDCKLLYVSQSYVSDFSWKHRYLFTGEDLIFKIYIRQRRIRYWTRMKRRQSIIFILTTTFRYWVFVNEQNVNTGSFEMKKYGQVPNNEIPFCSNFFHRKTYYFQYIFNGRHIKWKHKSQSSAYIVVERSNVTVPLYTCFFFSNCITEC